MKTKPFRMSNKDIVIQTAASLFLTQGYLLTSMDDIVTASNVSKTNIYYHYKNKEELLIATVDLLIDQFDQQIYHILFQQKLKISEKLERILHLFFTNNKGQDIIGGCPFLTLHTQAANSSEEVLKRIKAFFDRQLVGLEQALDVAKANGELSPSLSISATATLILSSIEGALFLSKASLRENIVEELYEGLVTLLSLKN